MIRSTVLKLNNAIAMWKFYCSRIHIYTVYFWGTAGKVDASNLLQLRIPHQNRYIGIG